MLIHSPPVQDIFIRTTFSKELQDKTTFSQKQQQYQYTTLSNLGLQKTFKSPWCKIFIQLNNIYEVYYLNISVKKRQWKTFIYCDEIKIKWTKMLQYFADTEAHYQMTVKYFWGLLTFLVSGVQFSFQLLIRIWQWLPIALIHLPHFSH